MSSGCSPREQLVKKVIGERWSVCVVFRRPAIRVEVVMRNVRKSEREEGGIDVFLVKGGERGKRSGRRSSCLLLSDRPEMRSTETATGAPIVLRANGTDNQLWASV